MDRVSRSLGSSQMLLMVCPFHGGCLGVLIQIPVKPVFLAPIISASTLSPTCTASDGLTSIMSSTILNISGLCFLTPKSLLQTNKSKCLSRFASLRSILGWSLMVLLTIASLYFEDNSINTSSKQGKKLVL